MPPNSEIFISQEELLTGSGVQRMEMEFERGVFEVGKCKVSGCGGGYCQPAFREAVRTSLDSGIIQLFTEPSCPFFKELPLYVIDFFHVRHKSGRGSISFNTLDWAEACGLIAAKAALAGVSLFIDAEELNEQCLRIERIQFPEVGKIF